MGRVGRPLYFHFPDGNASLARIMVRKLIPNAAPGKSMQDVVLAKFNYDQLDLPSNGEIAAQQLRFKCEKY